MEVFHSAVADVLDGAPKLGGQPAAVSSEQGEVRSDFRVRTFSVGESLFQDGDPKTHLHEITTGVVCVCRPGRPEEVIEFAFPGDVLGLGYLDHQIHCARALVKTQVKFLPLGSLANVLKCDLRAKQRHAEALHREFAYRRDLLAKANRQRPVGRVAAFLLVVSQYNKDEGRDPNIVTDALKCGVVAEWLKLDLDSLQRALVQLEKKQLIEPCTEGGLRLIDIGGLEALAGGSSK